ncbi:MAG: peptidylprolyl isomerase [Ruminococcus sp.]|nr:peptidylprolyl isomerase [Ruminococcus sp.]
MLKKLLAAFTALVICGAAFCGCSEKEPNNKNDSDNSSSSSQADNSGDSAADSSSSDSSSSTDSSADAAASSEPGLTIDGAKVDTKDLVMLTIDGRDIDFDTFRYYYFGTITQLTQSYGATLESIKATENGFEMLLDTVIQKIMQDYVSYRLADENGITLTDEDKAAAMDTYNALVEQAGSEEELAKALAESSLTLDVAKKMLEQAKLYEKTSSLFVEGGKYATSKDDFRKIVKDTDKYACVRSILIPYECQAEITDATDLENYDSYSLSEKSNAKKKAFNALDEEKQEEVKKKSEALAKEVLEKIKNGADFEEMLKEYGWDPGMESNPEGYYVTHETSFVPEYLEAVFKLKENEVVDEPVLSDLYGWFIIKRNPVDMDYIDKNIDRMINEYDTPTFKQVYEDTMAAMDIVYSDTYNKLTIDSIT